MLLLSLPAGKGEGKGECKTLSDIEGLEVFVTRFESVFGCTAGVEEEDGGGVGGATRAAPPSPTTSPPPPPTDPPALLSLLFTGTLRLRIGDGLGGFNGFEGDFVFLSAVS